jgi:serine/threonine protein phosphatase PrpC
MMGIFSRLIAGLKRSNPAIVRSDAAEKNFGWTPSRFGTSDLNISSFRVSGDLALDVAAVSCRGRGHHISGESRQDDFNSFETDKYFVAAVADGVSTSPNSHVGSHLVTTGLKQLFEKAFATKNVANVDAWYEINQSLSRNLVRHFAGQRQLEGQQIPSNVSELRELAADSLATTLEVVVVALELDENSQRAYTYIRVCGDGGLMHFNVQGKFSEVGKQSKGQLLGGKSRVAALPANDGMPEIFQGFLKPLESLVLCTDGISDFLTTDESWSATLTNFVRGDVHDIHALVDLITMDVADSYDDKTLVVLRSAC